jgi:adenylate cyclase
VAALNACRAGSNQDQLAMGCDLYAVRNKVVWSRGLPLMPPPPWVVHTSSIEKPFVTAEVPFLSPALRRRLELAFVKGQKPKALALSDTGNWVAKTKRGRGYPQVFGSLGHQERGPPQNRRGE